MNGHYVKNGIVKFKDVQARINELDPYNEEIYRKRDDLSLSRLFADVFQDSARFNVTAKEWFYYDGRVWKTDTGAMNVESYAKTFVKALQVYSIKRTDDSDFSRFVAKYGNRTNRKRMIEDARDFNFISQEEFDQDPDLFNCQNCVINLKTGDRIEHSPSLLLSKISNVQYDPDVKSKEFDRFIRQIMMDDEEKIQFLQKLFGYCLTGENTEEACFICYGSTTRNGKSTLLEVLGYMFGDYGMNIQPEVLEQRKKDSRTASGDIARLNGCRFLHMSEPPKKMKFDVALLKNLTGRDPITARHLYEREFEFIPIFKLVINTNFLPVVTDDSLFSSNRVKVITFDRHFEPEEQDRQLKRKLKSADNVTGLFNWCLEGLKMFRDDGEILLEPEAVRQATKDYREKSDKIANFIEDCLVHYPDHNTSMKDVYEVFGEWCQENGFGTENKSNFIEEIKSKGIYANTGTVKGKTIRNVVKNYVICENYSNSEIPFN